MKETEKRKFQDVIRIALIKYALVPMLILIIIFWSIYFIGTKMIFQQRIRAAGYSIAVSFSEMYQDYAISVKNIDKMTGDTKEIRNIAEDYYKFVNKQRIRGNLLIAEDTGEIVSIVGAGETDYYKYIAEQIVVRMSRTEKKFDSGYLWIPDIYNKGSSLYYIGYQAEGSGRYVVYVFDADSLRKLLDIEGAEGVVITDRYNNVLATSSGNYVNAYGKFQADIWKRNHEMSTWFIQEPQINVCVMNSQAITLERTLPYFAFLLVFLLGMQYLIRRLAANLSDKVTSPLKELSGGVRQLEKGDFEYQVNIHTGDEFETLADSYNQMTHEIKKLIDRNMELLSIQKQMEINQIKDQFNPHFLFNVLETLRYAVVTDTEKSQKIILLLSRLLKYVIYKKDNTAELIDDMEYIEDFLVLSGIRYGNCLSYDIEIDNETYYAKIPHLLLQPMVENSIKYGFRKHSDLLIQIRTYLDGNTLVLEIEDNGGGIDAALLDRVCDRNTLAPKAYGRVGLYNTHRMIQMVFGEAYGLHLNNQQGQGLTVVIRIPFQV